MDFPNNAPADADPGSAEILRIQIFRLACIVTASVSMALMLPLYMMQGIPVLVGTGVLALGLLSLVCYWASRRGQHLYLVFLLVLLANLDLSWSFDAGVEGGIAFYFSSVLLYPMTLFRGAQRWILSVLVAADLIGLVLMDHFNPGLSITFARPAAQLLDRITGFVCSSVIIAAIMWIILRSYDAEQSKLVQAKRTLLMRNAELHEALVNVKKLKGLLPICCGCKKIRDDTNYWHQVETYIAEHSEATFTHSYCPSCAAKYFPEPVADAPK